MTGPSERDERTGAELLRAPTWTKLDGGIASNRDAELLNELARLIEGDGVVDLSTRYGAAARILNAGWRPPGSAGEPKEDAPQAAERPLTASQPPDGPELHPCDSRPANRRTADLETR